jgi:hypothetical protein
MDFEVNWRAEAENRVLAQLLGLTSEEFTERVTDEMRGPLMTDRQGEALGSDQAEGQRPA